MKTAKSSYFGFGLFCLALAALAALQPHLPLWKNAAAEMPTESDILVLHLFFYFIAAVLLVIACSYLRTYVLTEEGIVHYFFGIRCRVTPWSEIQDISRVCLNPKRGVELLVCQKGTEVLRPRKKGFHAGLVVGNLHNQLFPMMTGKLLALKNQKDILECIKLYYGELDYDGNNKS